LAVAWRAWVGTVGLGVTPALGFCGGWTKQTLMPWSSSCDRWAGGRRRRLDRVRPRSKVISPARCGPQPNQTHERNTQMVTPAHACPPGQAPSPSTNWIQCSVCSRHFRASSSARLVGVAARAFPRSRTSSPGRHHWPPAAHHPLCARMIVFMSLQGPSGPGPPRAHARRPHATQTTGPARASHPLSPASVRPAGRRCGASLPTLHASCSAPGSVRVVCFYVLSSRTMMDGWMDHVNTLGWVDLARPPRRSG
jgi:hypothetical protein